MISFLTVIAIPAVQQVGKESFLGKSQVRIGELFNVIGYWVYQQGGVMGYALINNPELLAKLVVSPNTYSDIGKAIEELYSLRETVASELEQVRNEEKNFFHLPKIMFTMTQGLLLFLF